MEMNFRSWFQKAKRKISGWLISLVLVQPAGTEKREIRFSSLKWIAVSAFLIFVIVVLYLPNESELQFVHKGDSMKGKGQSNAGSANGTSQTNTQASALWGSPKAIYPGGAGGGQTNHNTSMIVGPKGGNANGQLHAGLHLPIRIIDKFIVSQDQVPILADLILDSVTESGLRLPAGTRLYGEASFQKGGSRAAIHFKQISLPSGQIRSISGTAAGKDGQLGIEGRVFSDGMKNSAGQVLTNFVSGLAAGSMQTDIFGRSQGGIQNGVLNAVAQTAQSRAQTYGEKLKAEREWIEVPAGQEADAILNESINLQEGGDPYEQR